MASISIARLESLLRQVVEQPFNWLSGGTVDPLGLAAHLLQLVSEEEAAGRDVEVLTVLLSPGRYRAAMEADESLPDEVSGYMRQLAVRTGMSIDEVPKINFAIDDTLRRGQARVAFSHVAGTEDRTEIFSIEGDGSSSSTLREADAFLIVGGKQHFPLDRPLTRIGRHVDNDLVISSPSVSRRQAQIRWRDPYFVVYDVTDRERTRLNGNSISGEALRPGDVIAMGDVKLVYGEGREKLPDEGRLDDDQQTLLRPG